MDFYTKKEDGLIDHHDPEFRKDSFKKGKKEKENRKRNIRVISRMQGRSQHQFPEVVSPLQSGRDPGTQTL